MATKLEYILTNFYKTEMISYLESHPGDFEDVIKLAISDKQPYSRKAAWLLWSCMDNDDPRIQDFVKRIIDILPKRNDNQQRELLIILQKMDINETNEGELFNVCVDTWEKIAKKPSVRFNAFKLIIKIAKKHPDLFNEVKLLTQNHYMDSLSDTVKRSVNKLIKEL